MRRRPPRRTPIGLKLATTSKKVSRAFDEALVAVGGSRPLWLILDLPLSSRRLASQQEELASAVGDPGRPLSPTTSTPWRRRIWVTRRRDPRNRRVHVVELTTKGDAAFHRMRGAAADFDRRLRVGLAETDMARLADLLNRLAATTPKARTGTRISVAERRARGGQGLRSAVPRGFTPVGFIVMAGRNVVHHGFPDSEMGRFYVGPTPQRSGPSTRARKGPAPHVPKSDGASWTAARPVYLSPMKPVRTALERNPEVHRDL